ncbi:MAG: septum formation initiator family protein [Thermoleophilia bacterium]|nr:septum formation initiator family protein [Thermoleophilia bacterium]
MAGLALAYVGPVRDYMHQKEQLRAEQVDLIEAREVRDDLSRQIKALGQPAVLEARARELGMVRPGETPYAVRGIAKPQLPPKEPVDDRTGVWGFITGLLG